MNFLKLKQLGNWANLSGINYQTYMDCAKIHFLELKELLPEIGWQRFKSETLENSYISDGMRYPYAKKLVNDFGRKKQKTDIEMQLIDKMLSISELDFYKYEILGWMHQNYYELDKKFVDKMRQTRSASGTQGELEKTTQIFTPEWIVKYLVENTLTYYSSDLIEDNEQMRDFCNYFVPCGLEFQASENLKILEPCAGCGMFIIQILDFLRQFIVKDIREIWEKQMITYADLDGSALEITNFICYVYNLKCGFDYYPVGFVYENELGYMNCDSEISKERYDVILTNPPYSSCSNLPTPTRNYLKEHFLNGKSDLCTAAMGQSFRLLKQGGRLGMITSESWMFLSSFENLRKQIFEDFEIITMTDFGAGAFQGVQGSVVQSVAFALQKEWMQDYKGSYFRLVNSKQKERDFLRAKLFR